MIQTYKDITYSLARSDRKTMSIYVEPDGRVSVRAPKNLSINKINKIIDLKSYWIYTSLSQVEQLNGSRVRRQIVDGEGFLYLGKSYRLKIDKDIKTPLALTQGYFILIENQINKAKMHFINFYKVQKGRIISAQFSSIYEPLFICLAEWIDSSLGRPDHFNARLNQIHKKIQIYAVI